MALGERGLLVGVAVASEAGEAAVEPLAPLPVFSTTPPVTSSAVAPPIPTVGTSAEELQLMPRIKEVELSNHKLEVEAMHLRVRALELERQPPPRSPTPAPPTTGLTQAPHQDSDVGKHIKLVPPFSKSEVDSFFAAFERVATALKWLEEVWALLLQCWLVGRAQEVCASLLATESLDYEVVKAAVLRAFELVPQAYHQKRSPLLSRHSPTVAGGDRRCFYCHELGHLITFCPVLRTKEVSQTKTTSSTVLFYCGPPWASAR